MIGGTQSSGPSPGGKDRKNLDWSLRVFSQDGHGVMIFCFWFLVVVRTHVVVEVRTHVVANIVCERCTHSLVARTFFCAQRTHCVLRTSSCVAHTCMAQGHEKSVCCVRMSSLLISPSPFSCFTRLRLPFLHGHFETNLTDEHIRTILPNFPLPTRKRGSSALRTRTSSLGYLAKSVLLTIHLRKLGLFIAVAEEILSTIEVLHHFKGTISIAIRSLATSLRRTPVEDQSMANLREKLCSSRRKTC